MAHNLNFNEASREFSFFSKKESAWHGLGQIVAEAVTAEEALKLAHLDYEVALAPTFASFIPKDCKVLAETPNGFPIVNFRGVPTGEYLKSRGERIPGSFATYRKDTMEVFGLVGSKYEVVQNITALDFIYDIIKNNDEIKDRNDIVIETAGALGKGENIFVTAKLPGYMRIGTSDDVANKYLVFTAGHMGNETIQALITNIRVVCNNTLNQALRSCTNVVRFKHTKNVLDNLQQGSTLLNLTNKYTLELEQALTYASTVQITAEQLRNYVYGIFLSADQFKLVDVAKSIKNVSEKEISARLRNKIEDVNSYIEAGVGQELFKGTAYWAYNGVTSYLNNGIDYKNNEDKFNSLLKGASAKVNQLAFDNMLNIL